MSGGLSLVLVALSFLSLVGFGFSGLLMSQAEARRKKRAQRVHDVVMPYRKGPVVAVQAFRPAPKNEQSLAEIAASIFGFDPGNLDQYPVRWWLVVGVAFVLARVVAGLLSSEAGTSSLILVALPATLGATWKYLTLIICRYRSPPASATTILGAPSFRYLAAAYGAE